jgi:hypothetical protein
MNVFIMMIFSLKNLTSLFKVSLNLNHKKPVISINHRLFYSLMCMILFILIYLNMLYTVTTDIKSSDSKSCIVLFISSFDVTFQVCISKFLFLI